jgi:hypothetical protein
VRHSEHTIVDTETIPMVQYLSLKGDKPPPPNGKTSQGDTTEMATSLTTATMLAMLTYLGFEATEGEDPEAQLTSKLDELDLTLDQFTTKETIFGLGYHRGLDARPFGDDQVPLADDGKGPNEDLMTVLEEAYGIGLEARELTKTPPPGLVYAGFEEGLIQPGAVAQWAATLDLTEGFRLAVAVTVGSGKNAITIPAGTPVDLLGDTERDGASFKVVLFDGSPVIIPDAEDTPAVVSSDSAVAPQKKTRKSSGKKSGPKAERGPTLKSAIIFVAEGRDGGPGPLQSNGAFAARVAKKCRDLGIGDKSAMFLQKADRHVPYYLNIYKPAVDKETGEITGPGRQGIMKPLEWVVAAILSRSVYLRAEGDHDAKIAAIADELQEKMLDREATIDVPEPVTEEPAPPAAE